ncbi:MAG: hypothetical protein JO110_30075, partial [Acetobacteraceae bacterium]|nr:hypothetical protein [Acetobacteraceae bacterium]
MHLTAFSLLVLPLCLIWALRPIRLLQLLAVVSVFEAAAALVLGSFGLQPGLVPACAFVAYVVLQLMLGARYPGAREVWRLVTPFLLVTVWAVVSSFIMPRLFEDQVYVWPQKSSPPFVLTRLHPTDANLNQVLYLLVNAAVLFAVALFTTKSRLRLRPLLYSYFIGAFAAAGVALWQLGSRVAHVPFPDDFFYSNPGWAILTEQTIGSGIPRINGPFSEPSALGGNMAAVVCCTGWLILQGHRKRVLKLLFATGLAGVVISTSATGVATLIIAGIGIVAYASLSGSRRLLASLMKFAVPAALLVGMAGVTAAAFAPSILTGVQQVFVETADKQDSTSYQDRTTADLDSIQAAIDTYGLGVGWGSNRSSSLGPGLLASLGVPGVAGLLWFGIALVRTVRQTRRAGTAEQVMVVDGCCGAIVGILVAAALAGPTITSV